MSLPCQHTISCFAPTDDVWCALLSLQAEEKEKALAALKHPPSYTLDEYTDIVELQIRALVS